MILLLSLNLGLIILDRLTKWFILKHPEKLFKNPKLYFWAVNSIFLYVVMGAVLVLLIFLFFKTLRKKNFLLSTGFLLVIFGGASNLFDRIFFGYVIDWIRVFFLPISIFNIADIMIVGGLACILIKLLFKNN